MTENTKTFLPDPAWVKRQQAAAKSAYAKALAMGQPRVSRIFKFASDQYIAGNTAPMHALSTGSPAVLDVVEQLMRAEGRA